MPLLATLALLLLRGASADDSTTTAADQAGTTDSHDGTTAPSDSTTVSDTSAALRAVSLSPLLIAAAALGLARRR